jgi:pimeloyl-ACP methyl ester carboxylesterase
MRTVRLVEQALEEAMWIAAVVLAALALPVLAALGYRELRRRRTARLLAIDTPRGIVEERYVRIGGVEQWIQIRGEDRTNPVLLVLHGGPGSPYAVFGPLIRDWEKRYTVVQWDRRGVGLTRRHSGPAPAADNTFARLTDDAVEVVEYLRQRLGVDKVTLMAGSMGTLIGIPLARRRPDLFTELVLTDLYVDMHRNEAVGYQKALDRVRAAGNAKAVAALEAIGADPAKWDLRAWQTKMNWTMKTDPVTPNAVVKLLFPLAFTSPRYSLRDVWHMLAGFIATQKQMYAEYMRYDARTYGMRFEVPVRLVQGATDVLTITELAEEYFAGIEAPAKTLALVENASHFTAFTRPQEFLRALTAGPSKKD